MKKLLTFILLLIPPGLAAQTDIYMLDYQKVNVAELSQTSYPLDPEAEAAVIYEKGEYRFIPFESGNMRGFHLHMTVTTKIKIYNEAGLEYAVIEIPYYNPLNEPEQVTIEGTTYNFDGSGITSTELSKTNIYTEKTSNDYSVKKVAFPDVRAGSVIELKYTIETPYFFNMRTWWFQKKIPVYYSKLTYRATPFYNYAFIARGLKKFDEQKSIINHFDLQFSRYTYKEIEYTYAMNRMAAFRDEEFLLNVDDYMANINFQLSDYLSFDTGARTDVMTTWPYMCRDLLKDPDFGKYMDAAKKEAKAILPLLGLEGKSDLEKFQAISEYVKGMYSWNRNIGKYARKKLSAFLKEKTGSSAELNLFMIGLMKAAGLDVYPVGLSTRDNGLIYKDYPFSRFINDVVAMAVIDGQNYFADASLSLTRYDELPYWCTNIQGLIINEKDPQWVLLEQNEPSSETKTLRMTVSPAEGKLHAEMKQELKGFQAYDNRNRYNGDIDKLREKYKGCEGMSISDMSVENFQQTQEPFLINMKYDITLGPAGTEPDKIYISPLLYIATAESPFKQARRTHPVDLIFSEVKNYVVEIEIPEGYDLEYLPQTVEKSNGIMNIAYGASADSNNITVKAGYAIKQFYETREYAALKEMYDDMVRAFSEVIILKKND